MPRRLFVRGLLPALALTLMGCETLPRLKAKPHAAESTDEILSKPEDAEKDGLSGKQSFFKNTRLKGGLSPEANAIERELGVRK